MQIKDIDMLDANVDKNFINKIETILKENDKIFLIDCSIELEKKFLEFIMSNEVDKKIFIVSDNNIYKSNKFENSSFTEYEKELLIKLYFMYEFTNKICLISDNNLYGNLFNYVDNNLLNYEEAFALILNY